MAVLGFGVWSLLIGHVIGALMRCVAVWLILDWSPRLRFYVSKARDLWSYGMNILFMNTLSIAIDQADPLMVGLLLGELQLGYYTVASKIPELVILNIGLDIRVISPELFSMMVVMALVTTFMTTPLLEVVCPRSIWEQEAALVGHGARQNLDLRTSNGSTA